MHVVRDGAIDALHTGHVAIVDSGGELVVGHGDPTAAIYPRSAIKPLQAAAVLQLADHRPAADEIAIMAASHSGTLTHQAVVLRLLDRAGLTPVALRCPSARPTDAAALRQRPEPTKLAHNCSGKHAGFLFAAVVAGVDTGDYLQPDHAVQRAVRARLRAAAGAEPLGPGVDGCGAPAWRLTVEALAGAFASLAGDDAELRAVVAAMRTHPVLVGGNDVIDTEVMRAEPALVAKRGAEGVLACTVLSATGALGVAVKVSDGAARAVGPVVVAILERLGLRGPAAFRRPAVLGGGEARGAIEVAPELSRSLARIDAAFR